MWQAITLLKPISPEQPSGSDLSFSRDFDAIAEARRFDDPSIEQGEWQTDLKEANWSEVIKLTSILLEQQSKDLRLAVWLSEASTYQHGFAGLAQGCELIAGLCEQFWETLYPEAEDGDQERRTGNISWIVKRAEQLIRTIPLTEGRGTSYSYADILDARNRAQHNTPRTDNSQPIVTQDIIEQARRKSSYSFYQQLLSDAQQCTAAINHLQTAVDARLGMEGPGFAALRQSLDDVMHTLNRFANDQGVSNQKIITTEIGEPMPETPTPPTRAGINSRAQAISQLREVARYFRETEPHSPVAYLADKAAQWGNLPLDEWLRTVIKDKASLSHIEELLGLDSQTDTEAR
ncbi:type VI secretion system protein TssA [Sulfuriferula nivalis]|uniref:Type VI secretion protein ImpA n=1 Tax=Sulfuriferula nivalis TaxID=2675298 RepID=A0A809SGL6_9PROT|nr:type VI secretion system protein TssA [Sulfuriferula nivalis]BBP00040.1 type VI secretion protein ImpA [Sulfuriferula nivalis]